MSWLIIMWSTFCTSSLLLFSSTTSSGFHPSFTIDNMEKCEHTFEKWINESLKAKDFLFEIKTVSYSLVNYFLVLVIWLQTGPACLCIWNISISTQLFLFLRITILQVLTVLEVCLCEPAMYKLNILGGENLNIINECGNHKKGGNQIFEIQ